MKRKKPMIEFEGVKFFEEHLKNYTSLIKAIESQGFKAIGSGAFSAVFKHRTKHFVIKVTAEDPKGVEWLKACAERSHSNPFLPRVYEVWDVEFAKPTRASRKPEFLSLSNDQLLNHYKRVAVSFIEVLKPYNDGDLAWTIERTLLNIPAMRVLFGGTARFKQFEEAALLIKSLTNGGKNGVDLHSENIMRRGDQLVINDPIAS